MIFAAIVGLIIAIAISAALYLRVLPARFDGTFKKKGLQFLHDYFTFKELYLETVLKAVFTIASISFITVGLLCATIGNIIDLFVNIGTAIDYGYFGTWVWNEFVSNFFGGIIIAIVGPLALRLVYEVILMLVLLCKNVAEINNKLKASEEEPAPATEVAVTAVEEIPAEEAPAEEAPAEEVEEVTAEEVTPAEETEEVTVEEVTPAE